MAPALDLPNRLDFCARMNFVLRHDGRRGTEPFNNRSDKWPDIRARQQDWHFAHHGVPLEGLPHPRYKFLQIAWRHGKLSFITGANDRFGKRLLPFG